MDERWKGGKYFNYLPNHTGSGSTVARSQEDNNRPGNKTLFRYNTKAIRDTGF